ncbi:MAG: DUF3631 domain-containing protein [Gammaproteobacteria bacterium]|nr:DUF3631 domain-containing protein [Gammaproteobacteria bacterium]
MNSRQGHELTFNEPEPSQEAVDAAVLLDELVAIVRRYSVVPEGAPETLALWCIHTYAHDFAFTSPYIALISPLMRCGKTLLLTLMHKLAYKSITTSNISPAALYRAVDKWHCTLFIDELDTKLKDNDELRGILNSGHTRDAAFVIRAVPPSFEPHKFSTWCPKMLALIGELPCTLADRSIEIPMRRKRRDEVIDKLRLQTCFDGIEARCRRWVADHAEDLKNAEPSIPSELHDRAADNWEPLLAIADLAGGGWPERARAAAKMLSASADENEDSMSITLLQDIYTIFQDHHTDRIASSTLRNLLVVMEGQPWAEWNSRGMDTAITARQVARLLAPFKIRPQTIRIGERTQKGYYWESFHDAFARYLPTLSVTPSHAHKNSGSDDSLSGTTVDAVTNEKPQND